MTTSQMFSQIQLTLKIFAESKNLTNKTSDYFPYNRKQQKHLRLPHIDWRYLNKSLGQPSKSCKFYIPTYFQLKVFVVHSICRYCIYIYFKLIMRITRLTLILYCELLFHIFEHLSLYCRRRQSKHFIINSWLRNTMAGNKIKMLGTSWR